MVTSSVQVKRLLRVLEQLRLGKPFTIGELAESCGASRRGVARDICLLCELGYPLQEDTDRHTWQMVLSETNSPFSGLDLKNVAMLVLATELSPLRRVPAIAERVSAALAAILGSLSPCHRQEIRRLTSLCEVDAGARSDHSRLGKVLLAVLEALRWGRNLRIVYESVDGVVVTAVVIPYRLVFSRGEWQLIGLREAKRELISVTASALREAVVITSAD